MLTPTVPLAQRVTWLARVPAFAGLPANAVAELAALLDEEHHPAGSTIVKEGEAGDRLYLIVDGRAEVSTATPSGPVPLALLEPGELFGEVALLSSSRTRQASVSALTPLSTLTLTDAAFADLLSRHRATRKTFAAAADAMATVKFLKQASPFVKLDPGLLRRLVDRLERIAVDAGDVVVRQGERGDACYLLCTGQVQVLAREDGAAERELTTLGPGALFGEAALLTDAPRNATVRAAVPSELLVLRRADLLEAIGAAPRVAVQVMELLRLRDRPQCIDGVVTQQRVTADGDIITILKDPQRYRYYRLTAPGWFLWQRLDGRHTIRDLTLEYYAAFRAFAPHVIADVVGGLAEAGFVRTRAVVAEAAGALVHASRWQRLLLQARRVLEWRVTISNVDAPITRLYRRGAYLLYTRSAQLFLGILAVAGLVAFASVSARAGSALLSGSSGPVLFLFLIPAYLFSILIHEAGHAFTTKAFGCEVPRVGIGWYWFSPIAFVDTSDTWLAERWPRIAVSLAGPYANVLLAGIASLAAWLTSNPVAVAALWQFAFVSYVMVLLNFNPLLEYDGYYVLMDLLERPNLRAHALAWLGKEFPTAVRTPERLKGHGMELAFGLGSVFYIVLMSGLVLVFYRLTVQSWMAHLLPAIVAASLAWVVAAGVAAASLAAVVGQLRGEA